MFLPHLQKAPPLGKSIVQPLWSLPFVASLLSLFLVRNKHTHRICEWPQRTATTSEAADERVAVAQPFLTAVGDTSLAARWAGLRALARQIAENFL